MELLIVSPHFWLEDLGITANVHLTGGETEQPVEGQSALPVTGWSVQRGAVPTALFVNEAQAESDFLTVRSLAGLWFTHLKPVIQ